MKTNTLEALLTTKQVAELLGLKAATLEKARSTGMGDFPPFVRFDRNVRYLRADIHAWIVAHRVDFTEGML